MLRRQLALWAALAAVPSCQAQQTFQRQVDDSMLQWTGSLDDDDVNETAFADLEQRQQQREEEEGAALPAAGDDIAVLGNMSTVVLIPAVVGCMVGAFFLSVRYINFRHCFALAGSHAGCCRQKWARGRTREHDKIFEEAPLRCDKCLLLWAGGA